MSQPSDDEIEEHYEKAMAVSDDPIRYDETRAREVDKAQLVVNKRLVNELKETRESINQYRRTSMVTSLALIFLSLALLVVSLAPYLSV